MGEDTASPAESDVETPEDVVANQFWYTSPWMDKNAQLRDELRELGTQLNKTRERSRRILKLSI